MYVLFPAFRQLKRSGSVYVYHYTLVFEPDFCLNNEALQIPDALPNKSQWCFCGISNSRSFDPKPETITSTLRRWCRRKIWLKWVVLLLNLKQKELQCTSQIIFSQTAGYRSLILRYTIYSRRVNRSTACFRSN